MHLLVQSLKISSGLLGLGTNRSNLPLFLVSGFLGDICAALGLRGFSVFSASIDALD
jgi:hypothetical protein